MPTYPMGNRLFPGLLHSVTTEADSGDNTVIAAPGTGLRLVIVDLVIQNESATATTVLVKSGSTTKWRSLLDQYRAFSLSAQQPYEFRLGTNEALVVNLSGANSHGVSVRYFVEVA